MNKIIPILINQRISPYKVSSFDNINLKAMVFQNNRIQPIYLSNLPINLYLNYSGTWMLAEQGTTNRFGYLTLYHSCENIDKTLTNCLAKFTTIVNGESYESNISRINFVEGGAKEFGKDQFILLNDYIVFDNDYYVF